MSPEKKVNHNADDDEPIRPEDVKQGISQTAIDSDEVEIKIGGALYHDLKDIADQLNDIDLNRSKKGVIKQVVVKAIALLQKSQGKEIVLKDKAKNTSETINLWR